MAGALFGIAVAYFSHGQMGSPEQEAFSLFIWAAMCFSGFWLATGQITTDDTGITKREMLLFRRTLSWHEITRIRHLQRRGVVQLFAGERKLEVDMRFIALAHLLDETVARTKLEVVQ